MIFIIIYFLLGISVAGLVSLLDLDTIHSRIFLVITFLIWPAILMGFIFVGFLWSITLLVTWISDRQDPPRS
jgi:hypothetical protein